MFPLSHSPIIVGHHTHDMGHLNAFEAAIPGKGVEPDSDLMLQVCFSNHVATERSKHGGHRHTKDHNGTWRFFDPERYAMSKDLPDLLRKAILENALAFVSSSFGGSDNLILLEGRDGRNWSIVFCLRPTETGVRMEVLSAHPKLVKQAKVSRKPLSYFARMCAFKRERVPKIKGPAKS